MTAEEENIATGEENKKFISGLFVAFVIGMVFTLIVVVISPHFFSFFGKDRDKGKTLTISDLNVGVFYNKIEQSGICVLEEEGVANDEKAYFLLNCPSRFVVGINGAGEYEIIPAPLKKEG